MKSPGFRYCVIIAGRPAAALSEAAGALGVKAAAFFCRSPGCAVLLSGYKDWSEWQRWGEEEDGEAVPDEEDEEEAGADAGPPPATPTKPA